MPENSSKRERFKRLASRRTSNVLKALKVLGNCANTGAYEYSSKEVDSIFNAIDKQLRVVKNKFQIIQDEKTEFKL